MLTDILDIVLVPSWRPLTNPQVFPNPPPHCVQKNVFCVLLSLWFCGQWVMWSRVRFRQWRICLNLWFSMWWTIEISDIKQWKGEGHKQYESKESLTNYQWDNPVYTFSSSLYGDLSILYNYHIRWPDNYKYLPSGRSSPLLIDFLTNNRL